MTRTEEKKGHCDTSLQEIIKINKNPRRRRRRKGRRRRRRLLKQKKTDWSQKELILLSVSAYNGRVCVYMLLYVCMWVLCVCGMYVITYKKGQICTDCVRMWIPVVVTKKT